MYILLVMSGVKNIERYQEYKNFKLNKNKKTDDLIVHFFIMLPNILLIIF